MRFILVTGLLLAMSATMSACGQKGNLYIPKTPAAQQRATLPQTLYGGASAPARPASAASAAQQPAPPMPLTPALPDQPDSADSQ